MISCFPREAKADRRTTKTTTRGAATTTTTTTSCSILDGTRLCLLNQSEPNEPLLLQEQLPTDRQLLLRLVLSQSLRPSAEEFV